MWVDPSVAWFELFVPAGDPWWRSDVGRAFEPPGDAVAAALALPGAVVHRGGSEAGRWGTLVCFAGIGPGEVTVGGRKLVGWTQRRTREGSRFAGIVYPRWDPGPLVAALALSAGERRRLLAELDSAGTGSLDWGLGGAAEVLHAVRAALSGP